MKHMDDETTAIICEELKLTAANFWVIIHRTKLNLRACLTKKLDLTMGPLKKNNSITVKKQLS